jgi:hypothetical protein
MKSSDIAVAAVIYGIATWFLVMTVGLPPEAQTYPLLLIGALYAVNTLFIGKQLYRFIRHKHFAHDFPHIFSGFQATQFFGVVAGCVLYLVLLETLGYYISSVVYLLGAQFFLKVRPVPAIISCVCVMVVTYLVFSLFLKVPLPAGIFFS